MNEYYSLKTLANDEKWMGKALELAHFAAKRGEVPVGAVIVKDGQLVSQAGNLKESKQDPLGHAELIAIRRAAETLGHWRLTGCTLYVTLEPCIMCAGAIIQSRIERVVYSAKDPKGGAVHSLYELFSDPRLNHQPKVQGSLRAEESTHLLKTFFRERRLKNI